MNIVLKDAAQTIYNYPQPYCEELLDKIWDFDQPASVYDLEETFVENSLFVIPHEYLADYFIWNTLNHDITIEKIKKFAKIQNKKILIDFSSKTLHSEYAKFQISNQHKTFLAIAQFRPENVYYVVQTKKDCEILKENLQMDVNVCNNDRWLDELFRFQIRRIFQLKNSYLTLTDDLPKKKFSVFIRRFEPIRFQVICELLRNNIIDEFHYSFCGDMKDNTIIDLEKLSPHIESLPAYFTASDKEKIKEWAKGIPYGKIKNFDYGDLYSHALTPYFNSSDINLVVESHVEDSLGNAAWSSLTEKTYKAMLYKKSFLLFSHPHALKYLRDCGYKTFSPYIDETYDDIIDTSERLLAIVSEIIRINNLPDLEYQALLANCQEVIEHNYKILLQTATAPISEKFLIKNMKFL